MSRYPNLKTGLANIETSRWAFDQAALVPANQAILEIGVFRARTTCWLAHGAKSGKGAHVWGVDPWDLPTANQPKAKFRDPKQRRLAQQHVHEAGVRSQVTLVQAFSVDFARGWTGPRIGLTYIDGDHSFEGAVDDFEAWRPHLAADAVIAFDDYGAPSLPGVKQAVDYLVAEGRITEPEVVGGRLAVSRLP